MSFQVGDFVKTSGSGIRHLIPNGQDQDFYYWNDVEDWPNEKVLKSDPNCFVVTAARQDSGLPVEIGLKTDGLAGRIVDSVGDYHLVRFKTGSEVLVSGNWIEPLSPLIILAGAFDDVLA